MVTYFTRTTILVWCKKFAYGQKSIDEEQPGHAASNQHEAAFLSGIHKLVDRWSK